jgi:hypothetical protein
MQTRAANTAVKSVPQGCHGVDVGANDESLDHRAGLAVSASVSDAIGDNDNGRAV